MVEINLLRKINALFVEEFIQFTEYVWRSKFLHISPSANWARGDICSWFDATRFRKVDKTVGFAESHIDIPSAIINILFK